MKGTSQLWRVPFKMTFIDKTCQVFYHIGKVQSSYEKGHILHKIIKFFACLKIHKAFLNITLYDYIEYFLYFVNLVQRRDYNQQKKFSITKGFYSVHSWYVRSSDI